MAEQTVSGNEPEKDARTLWEEAKQRMQGDFSVSMGSTIALDHIRMQRQLNAKFWANEILHEHLGDRTIDEANRQLEQDIEPER